MKEGSYRKLVKNDGWQISVNAAKDSVLAELDNINRRR